MQPVASLVRQGSISFLLGLALGTFFLDAALQQQFFVMALGLVGVVLGAIGGFAKKRKVLCAGLLILGFWYVPFRSSLLQLHFSHIQHLSGIIHFVEPLIDKQRLIITVREPVALSGRVIFVYTERFPDHFVGEKLDLKCSLEPPAPIEGFAFDKYAQRRGIVGICRYPKVTITGHEENLASFLDRLRKFYSNAYTRELPASEDALLQAMVLNKTGEFPQRLLVAFSASGLSHSISVSGLHMSLLIVIVELMLGALGFARPIRLVILVAGLSAYLILLGFPSPAVRSSIMGVLMIWAQHSGRQAQGTHILILTATAMLLQNPLSLGFDIGFQLSCLALLGMGLTNAYWKQLLHFLPERFAIREVFAATCSAQIYTWPLTLYYFGSLSLIAPVANAVVLPLLPFLLSLAFLAPLLSTVPFVYPVSMVLLFIVTKVMNSAVLFFGAIPYAAAKNIHFTFIQTISSLLLMALVTRFWFMHSKKQPYE